MIDDKDNYKSGFVAIIGRPNVGKSTLLNNIIGQKIAIMSDKPQTTRNKITGIYTNSKSQIVFLDTPGLHVPKHSLGKYMISIVHKTLIEVDAVLYLVEAGAGYGAGDNHIVKMLSNIKTPVFLGLNKIDKFEDNPICQELEEWKNRYTFRDVISISALTGKNTDVLLDSITDVLPFGPQYYPEDMITDQPERQIISEFIREKALHLTREEVPHSLIAVVEYLEKKDDILKVYAVIYTERDSQKGIVIGKNGQMLKNIGQSARKEIENLLGSKIYLDIRVKVKKNWRKKENALRELGYILKD